MAVCTFCGTEMLHGTVCSEESLRIGENDYEPIRWGDERATGFAAGRIDAETAVRRRAASITTAATSSSARPA